MLAAFGGVFGDAAVLAFGAAPMGIGAAFGVFGSSSPLELEHQSQHPRFLDLFAWFVVVTSHEHTLRLCFLAGMIANKSFGTVDP